MTGRRRGTVRPRGARGPVWTGRMLELTVDRVAHGGHCVGRYDGRVVFVRHALPGEVVRARVTEDRGGAFCRADAVEVVQPSPDRVQPPCPYAGPGRCGGCDWQHADPGAQRALKAAVVREQLTRLAGRGDVAVEVEEVPGGPLRWRTRAQFAVDPAGRAGLRRHRRHDVVALDDCLITHPDVLATGVLGRSWLPEPDAPGDEIGAVEVAAGGDGRTVIATVRARSTDAERRLLPGSAPAVSETAAGRSWQVTGGAFWQVHPAAAQTLADCVRDFLEPRPGERGLDLYAGVGLFAGVLADAVGPDGAVLALEGDPVAVEDATVNLAPDRPGSGGVVAAPVEVARMHVDAAAVSGLAAAGRGFDVVVLDPPRAGAGKAVCLAIAELGPRAVAYVACDPASLARDVAAFEANDYRLERLRAFDLFPMTHHVECVALLVRASK